MHEVGDMLGIITHFMISDRIYYSVKLKGINTEYDDCHHESSDRSFDNLGIGSEVWISEDRDITEVVNRIEPVGPFYCSKCGKEFDDWYKCYAHSIDSTHGFKGWMKK